MSDQPLLQVTDLSKVFDLTQNPWLTSLTGGKRIHLPAVDGVTFEIPKGKTFGLVGESGSGKSTVARMCVGLLQPSSGAIKFAGTRVTAPGGGRGIGRGRLQMIFQDPFASVNPRWRVVDIIREAMRTKNLSARDQIARVGALLEQVGLTAADGEKFPHEFSGGQRQRISIARALASEPEFLVCDEPTSALDVSVQAQILNLMKELQTELGLTYLFISHDLAVVSHVSDVVGVMYLGRLVEIAPKDKLFENPQHPYTRMLLEAIPRLDLKDRHQEAVVGEVANPLDRPKGCHYHPRCPFASDRCKAEDPSLKASGDTAVACHGVDEARLPTWSDPSLEPA
ncbi:MAG: ABC transporter ATP-binding protein [Sphingomonadales bacterium]|nr:MAG: ABC transporter ATP-binding protein [Sphingomonadales bacterium]